jgi:carbonic anhydrase
MDLQLSDVLAANEQYRRTDFHAAPRTPQPSRHLVILTCMDARLGLEVGDAHILRNAGGRASDDAIRSLVVSTHLLGTREIVVIHHTNCGLEGMTDDDVAQKTGVTGIEYLAFEDVEESVRTDVAAIRAFGQLPQGTVVWGAVYDVNDGSVRVVADPDVD